MTRTRRLAAAGLAAALAIAAPAAAQEPVSAGAGDAQWAPGWTFTPALGFVGTYDDNITLFGRGTAEAENDDLIASYAPQAELTYRGRRTRFGIGYAGSFLDYRTFDVFNRWQQRARVEMRRDQTQRLQFSGHASTARTPSTDQVDLGGIPFSHTGAELFEWRAGSSYRITARDNASASIQYQNVRFDRPDELRQYLRGGQAAAVFTGYRRRLDARLAVGADYGFRRAEVVDDTDAFVLHTTQAALEYDLSSAWTATGGAGIVFLQATTTSESQRAPAFRGSLDWSGRLSAFQVGYERSFIPSFGYGGTVRSQEISARYRTALFRSRRLYTDQSVMFRDNTPLVAAPGRIRLRSLRTNSVVGWTPQPWVRFEVFYARTQQTSLRPGGRLDRNRIGFQIVTSKPMRMQ